MISRTRLGLALVALVVMSAGAAPATAAIYLDMPGVPGDSRGGLEKNWIDIQSFGIGVSRAVSSGGGPTGAIRFTDLQLVKNVDGASVHLFEALVTGENFHEATLNLTGLIGGTQQVYAQWELKNAQVTSFQTSGHGNTLPSESISMNFEEITYRYFEFDKLGNQSGVAEFGWNLRENTQTSFIEGEVTNFAFYTGTLPEPTTGVVVLGGAMLLCCRRARR